MKGIPEAIKTMASLMKNGQFVTPNSRRIVNAIEIMANNADGIGKIDKIPYSTGDVEFYFPYAGHQWSMKYSADDRCYRLYHYKGMLELHQIQDPTIWNTIDFTCYKSSDLGKCETFRRLYGLLEERESGMDKALSVILSPQSSPVQNKTT